MKPGEFGRTGVPGGSGSVSGFGVYQMGPDTNSVKPRHGLQQKNNQQNDSLTPGRSRTRKLALGQSQFPCTALDLVRESLKEVRDLQGLAMDYHLKGSMTKCLTA
jgi:hypothetical protein